jgi:hypothetical protein
MFESCSQVILLDEFMKLLSRRGAGKLFSPGLEASSVATFAFVPLEAAKVDCQAAVPLSRNGNYR